MGIWKFRDDVQQQELYHYFEIKQQYQQAYKSAMHNSKNSAQTKILKLPFVKSRVERVNLKAKVTHDKHIKKVDLFQPYMDTGDKSMKDHAWIWEKRYEGSCMDYV